MNEHIRHLRRQISREHYISRLPALFPYISVNELGVVTLHSALDSANGCYGKIIPNLHCDEAKFNEVVSDYDPKQGITYRVMMDKYYAMKRGDISSVDAFITFIENTIGKIECDADLNWNECDLATKTHYIASIPKEYTEQQNAKALVTLYNALVSKGEHDVGLCCAKERYERMGGDVMLQWLKAHLEDGNDIAENLKKCAIATTLSPAIHCNINLTGTSSDMGLVYPLIEIWQKGKSYVKGQLIIYNDRLYRVKEDADIDGKAPEIVCGSKWNDLILENEFNEDAFVELIAESGEIDESNKNGFTYISESQLKDCRRPIDYTNTDGDIEIPEKGEDWLFYYRVNEPANLEVITDELGNISTIDGRLPQANNLAITGNIIESITNVTNDEGVKVLRFRYVIGAHLLLVGSLQETTDDDGQIIYRIPSDAQYKRDGKTGVEFTEDYIYEDEETRLLVEGGIDDDGEVFTPELDYFIGLKQPGKEQQLSFDSNAKYPFSTVYNQMAYNANFGDTAVGITAVLSNVTEYGPSGKAILKTEKNDDIQHIPYLREEYQYGVSYPDEVTDDVYIRRGNGAAFERHIKLSEVKTMDDIDNYANGGFFNVVTANG